jgi:hypothetical protein
MAHGLPRKVTASRRLLRVFLCYVLVVQATVAMAVAASALDTSSASVFSICHSSAADAPADGGGSTTGAACNLCAIAASSITLVDAPALGSLRALRTATIERHAPDVWSGSIRARAGSARAPPPIG